MEQHCSLTQERLKEVLDYNPDTGFFTWIESLANRALEGSRAGTRDGDGYIQIGIDGRRYFAHRLAILYTDGYLPENTVDHIDRVPWHNWRLNLREASYQCQQRNCKMRSDNTSGAKGIYWHKLTRKWIARICVNGKMRNLGLYTSILDAAFARFAAEQCLGFPECDIHSSAKQYIDSRGGWKWSCL